MRTLLGEVEFIILISATLIIMLSSGCRHAACGKAGSKSHHHRQPKTAFPSSSASSTSSASTTERKSWRHRASISLFNNSRTGQKKLLVERNIWQHSLSKVSCREPLSRPRPWYEQIRLSGEWSREGFATSTRRACKTMWSILQNQAWRGY